MAIREMPPVTLPNFGNFSFHVDVHLPRVFKKKFPNLETATGDISLISPISLTRINKINYLRFLRGRLYPPKRHMGAPGTTYELPSADNSGPHCSKFVPQRDRVRLAGRLPEPRFA